MTLQNRLRRDGNTLVAVPPEHDIACHPGSDDRVPRLPCPGSRPVDAPVGAQAIAAIRVAESLA